MKQIIAILMLTGLLAMTTIVVQASRRFKEKYQNRCSEALSLPENADNVVRDVYVQSLFVFE